LRSPCHFALPVRFIYECLYVEDVAHAGQDSATWGTGSIRAEIYSKEVP